MKAGKHKFRMMAVKNLRPGHGIEFILDKPWGLASLIYKSGLHKTLDLTLTINHSRPSLTVVRAPEIRRWV